MIKRPLVPKHWLPISSSDGVHHGYYEVSGGMLTVRLGELQKTVSASSARVSPAMGASADEGLAGLVLSELAAEGLRPK
jgi:hypothetical protein